MNCNELPVEDLVAWLDGETDAAASARIEAHVAGCRVCAAEAAALRKSAALLARLPSMAPPAGFEDRVVAAMRGGSATPAPRGRVLRLTPRLVAAAAAVLVCVTAGTWWLTRESSEPGEVLTAREEEALAEDLLVISNLDALQRADAKELAQLVEDLDVIDVAADAEGG